MIDCLISSHHQVSPVAARSERNTNGSQLSWMLNIRMNTRPVKNVGKAKPMNASVLAIWSKAE